MSDLDNLAVIVGELWDYPPDESPWQSDDMEYHLRDKFGPEVADTWNRLCAAADMNDRWTLDRSLDALTLGAWGLIPERYRQAALAVVTLELPEGWSAEYDRSDVIISNPEYPVNSFFIHWDDEEFTRHKGWKLPTIFTGTGKPEYYEDPQPVVNKIMERFIGDT